MHPYKKIALNSSGKSIIFSQCTKTTICRDEIEFIFMNGIRFDDIWFIPLVRTSYVWNAFYYIYLGKNKCNFYPNIQNQLVKVYVSCVWEIRE